MTLTFKVVMIPTFKNLKHIYKSITAKLKTSIHLIKTQIRKKKIIKYQIPT